MLDVQLYTYRDAATAIHLSARALAGQFKVFGRCMQEHAARAGANCPAYKDIGGFMSLLSDVDRCRETILSEWPRYMAIWGDADRCPERIGELVERLKPSGLIFNIDSGGIAFDEIEPVMRYTAETILPGVRERLAAN